MFWMQLHQTILLKVLTQTLFFKKIPISQVAIRKKLQIEMFDATVSLSNSLGRAPIPDIKPESTANERFSKMDENERKFPRMGLEVLVDHSGNGSWTPRCEITLQNYGDKKRSFPILQPYLTAVGEVFLLGPSAKLAVIVKDKGNGLLKSRDRIILTLGWVDNVTLIPKDRGVIKTVVPLKVTVTDERRKILYDRLGRRAYSLQNVGEQRCWFMPGDAGSSVTPGNGLLLEPGGIHSFGNSDAWLFTQPVWAVCDSGKDTTISGFEGIG